MKRLISLFIMFLFIGATGLFGAGAKETPMERTVREWGNNFTTIVILLIVVLCVVGLIKFITTRKR
jgi:hypothetical protein